MSVPDTKSIYRIGRSELIGRHVRLEPLTSRTVEKLRAPARNTDARWLSNDIEEDAGFDRYYATALQAKKDHTEIPFIIYSIHTGSVIGSTRYMDIRWEHKGLEIGNSWYDRSYWGTVVNPECKYLLLRNAFEEWDAIRVQIKADTMNQHSTAAIAKLGARFEGILRNHKIRRDGTIRDTAMFSITKEDWPALRPGLEARINAFESS